MEKFIFLASVKDKLKELNVPDEIIEKHLKTFEDCFKGKNAEEIDKIIEGAGGVDGIINSIYNLESAKNTVNNAVEIDFEDVNDAPTEQVPVIRSTDSKSDIDVDKIFDDITEDDPTPDTMTKEIPASAVLSKHIKEAEELSNTLEKTAVHSAVNSEDIEFSEDFSDYDFEKLFAEDPTLLERLIIKLKSKMSDKVFKYTLPLAFIVIGLMFLFVIALYVLLAASAVALSLVYIGVLIGGVAFALIPTGYGAYVYFFKDVLSVAFYELGTGIAALGLTMIISILLYNYVRRLVPFIFKLLKRLFNYCVRLTKRYFAKPAKEME